MLYGYTTVCFCASAEQASLTLVAGSVHKLHPNTEPCTRIPTVHQRHWGQHLANTLLFVLLSWEKTIWLSDKKGALQSPRRVLAQCGQCVSAAENISVYTHSWSSLEEAAKGVQNWQIITFGHSGRFQTSGNLHTSWKLGFASFHVIKSSKSRNFIFHFGYLLQIFSCKTSTSCRIPIFWKGCKYPFSTNIWPECHYCIYSGVCLYWGSNTERQIVAHYLCPVPHKTKQCLTQWPYSIISEILHLPVWLVEWLCGRHMC